MKTMIHKFAKHLFCGFLGLLGAYAYAVCNDCLTITNVLAFASVTYPGALAIRFICLYQPKKSK